MSKRKQEISNKDKRDNKPRQKKVGYKQWREEEPHRERMMNK
jgi:hypothetical protein